MILDNRVVKALADVFQNEAYVKRWVATLSVVPLLVALAGCHERQATSYNSTSNYTLATLPGNTALTITAHQGLEAYTATNTGAVAPTVTVTGNPTASDISFPTGFNLTLPDGGVVDYNTSAGAVDVVGTQTYKATVQNGSNTIETMLTNGATSALSYSTYGVWLESDMSGNMLGGGVFATGIPTAAPQMPTTGTGTYTGNISGIVSTPNTFTNITGGAVNLSANFGNNIITGSITNVTTGNGLLNDINLTAGVISGTSFTGTAAPAAATAVTTINITGATGQFGGKFYGPNAAEAAGSISMTGSGNTVLAAFGAHH